jgi:hypothetical protein
LIETYEAIPSLETNNYPEDILVSLEEDTEHDVELLLNYNNTTSVTSTDKTYPKMSISQDQFEKIKKEILNIKNDIREEYPYKLTIDCQRITTIDFESIKTLHNEIMNYNANFIHSEKLQKSVLIIFRYYFNKRKNKSTTEGLTYSNLASIKNRCESEIKHFYKLNPTAAPKIDPINKIINTISNDHLNPIKYEISLSNELVEKIYFELCNLKNEMNEADYLNLNYDYININIDYYFLSNLCDYFKNPNPKQINVEKLKLVIQIIKTHSIKINTTTTAVGLLVNTLNTLYCRCNKILNRGKNDSQALESSPLKHLAEDIEIAPKSKKPCIDLTSEAPQNTTNLLEAANWKDFLAKTKKN